MHIDVCGGDKLSISQQDNPFNFNFNHMCMSRQPPHMTQDTGTNAGGMAGHSRQEWFLYTCLVARVEGRVILDELASVPRGVQHHARGHGRAVTAERAAAALRVLHAVHTRLLEDHACRA